MGDRVAWKIRWLVFQGLLKVWTRKIFSSRQTRAATYRQRVDESAFETWMDWGGEFERILSKQIARAERDRRPATAQFWRDVMESAKAFEADPENRRRRDAITLRQEADSG